MSEQAKERRNWIGVSLLVIGAAFLSRNFNLDLFHIPDYVYSWEFLLMAIGLILLLTGRRSGIALIAIGAFFLYTNEFMTAMYHFGSWWPIILIILGVILLLRPANRPSQNNGDTSVKR